ncbi:MAG: homogentisate 1,2-dioxygenase, partial [Burkholderiaceae bacterium]|nr:homogentisate 1,2-dioxygenase [Burkholderiaceae bacterium]
MIDPSALRYQTGFANELATEALPGALPKHQNSPQRCAYGLIAEQVSGTAFTAPRHANRRSWLYRIRPAAMHAPFKLLGHKTMTNDFDQSPTTPNQLRWDPQVLTSDEQDFVESWFTMAGNGSAA